MRGYCLLNHSEKIQENVTNDNSLQSKPTVVYVKKNTLDSTFPINEIMPSQKEIKEISFCHKLKDIYEMLRLFNQTEVIL